MTLRPYSNNFFSLRVLPKKVMAISLLLGMLLYFISCHERSISSYQLVDEWNYDYIYNEIACKGRWSSKYTDEELKNVVLHYFKDSCKIEIDTIVVSQSNEPRYTCDSCGCWTGRDVYISALGKYSSCLNGADFLIELHPEYIGKFNWKFR